MTHDTLYYSNLSREDKDKVVSLLLDKLNLEIYDPYERGPQGVRLREKEEDED